MLKITGIAVLLLGATTIFSQDVKDEDVKAQEINYEKPTEWSLYAADEPVSTFVLNGDELWYATPSSVFLASLKKRTVQAFATVGTMPGADVTSMSVNGGSVCIGAKNGLAIKNGSTFTVFTAENGLPDNSVTAVLGADGKVWVGTEKGLTCYNGGSFKVFTTKDGLSHDGVTALTADNSGKVWVGTKKGISVYDGSKWTIYDMKKGLSWNQVKALAFDARKKAIWAAVGEKDINTFSNGEWSTFMDIREGVTSLMIDSQSRVWVGSSTGLMKYNGDEWIDDPKKLYIPAAQVQWMQRDGSGNLFYACENGIVRLSNPYPY